MVIVAVDLDIQTGANRKNGLAGFATSWLQCLDET
jgi:hypothetical protein